MNPRASRAKVLAASACFAMAAAAVAPPASAASAQEVAPNKPSAAAGQTTVAKLLEGKPSKISGRVPVKYQNSLVVLEKIKNGQRQEVKTAVSDRTGNVSVTVRLAGEGSQVLRWRVVRDGKTMWTGKPFRVTLTPTKAPHADIDGAYRVFEQAQDGVLHEPVQEPQRSRSGRSVTPREGVRADAVSSDVVTSLVKKSTGILKTSVVGVLEADLGTRVTDGMDAILHVLFPDMKKKADPIEELTDDVNQQFQTVDADLQEIINDLNQISQQVTTIQQDVIQSQQTGAFATCDTLLAEGNLYVSEIQRYVNEYQVVTSPGWIEKNLVGQSPQQALRLIGNQVFGVGQGNPSFGPGVVDLQQSVDDLAALLNQNGGAGTPGLVATCASAVSAGVAENYGSYNTGSILPVGAVESDYFTTLQTLISSYTNWVSMGQVLATRGGQAAVMSLTGLPADKICPNPTPRQGASALSCDGIAYNTSSTYSEVVTALRDVGASWYQVSDGALIGDARADNSNAFVQPSRSAWAKDIALYGQARPGLQNPNTVNPPPTDAWQIVPNSIEIINGSATGGSLAWDKALFTINPTNGWVYIDVQYYPNWTTSWMSISGPTGENWYYNTGAGWDTALNSNSQLFSTGEDGVLTQTVQWGDGSTSQIQLTVEKPDQPPAYYAYYEAKNSLSSESSPSTTTPAAGMANMSTSTWMGLNFEPATTQQWQWLLPYQNQNPANTNYNSVAEDLYAQGGDTGLANNGTIPTGLIIYTGEGSTWDINDYTPFGSPPTLGPDTSLDPNTGATFADSTLSVTSFMDLGMPALPSYGPVVGAPTSAGPNILYPQWYMNDMQVTSGSLNSSCEVPKGTGSCTGTYSADWMMSAGGNGALTQNPSFYTPLTQTNTYTIKVTVASNGGSATYSNQTAVLGESRPSFLGGGTPQNQFLWPALQLPTMGAPPPCTMTQFETGASGGSGGGQVCQYLFDQWAAGALGITTGPVSISGGTVQGTVTTTGNNVAEFVINNESSTTQTVTVYAGIAEGDAAIGDIIESGTGTLEANVNNCSSFEGQLQCTVTVQPGASLFTLPITGVNGANTYTEATLELGLAGKGMYDSSATKLLPIATQAQALPEAVTDLTANSDPASDRDAPYADLTWTVPVATPALTGYLFNITDPNGIVTTQTVTGSGNGTGTTISNGYTTGGTATANLRLPTTQGGLWEIQVTALNAGGRGPAADVQASLGSSAPPQPRSFTAVENDNSTISLAWKPVTASPALSNYNITVTPPPTDDSGTPAKSYVITVNTPAYVIQNVPSVGNWAFELTAVNSIGSSVASTVSVNVTGNVPTQPLNLDVDVNAFGWISAVFDASTSVPTADTYWIGVFEPGADEPVASFEIPVSVHSEKIRVRNFYQLGSQSPAGGWTVVVSPSNSIGVGEPAASTLFVGQDLLKEMGNRQHAVTRLTSIPTHIRDYIRKQCAADGTWHTGMKIFGLCTKNRFQSHDVTTPGG